MEIDTIGRIYLEAPREGNVKDMFSDLVTRGAVCCDDSEVLKESICH